MDAEDGIDSDTDADEEGGIHQNDKPRTPEVKKMLVEGNKVLIGNSHQARMIFDPKRAATTSPFEAGNSLIKKAKVKEKKEQDRRNWTSNASLPITVSSESRACVHVLLALLRTLQIVSRQKNICQKCKIITRTICHGQTRNIILSIQQMCCLLHGAREV